MFTTKDFAKMITKVNYGEVDPEEVKKIYELIDNSISRIGAYNTISENTEGDNPTYRCEISFYVQTTLSMGVIDSIIQEYKNNGWLVNHTILNNGNPSDNNTYEWRFRFQTFVEFDKNIFTYNVVDI